MSGTSEKSSTLYWLWISTSETNGSITKLMVPDLTGTADADVLNSLSASAMSFVTDKVSSGDEIYQTTDFTKGYVKAVSAEGLLTCMDKDGNDLDLFPNGNEDFIIRLLSPTGLSAYKARIGAAYNDGSSNIVGCGYTKYDLQKRQRYTGAIDASAEYTLSGSPALSSVEYAFADVYQVFTFGNIPLWIIENSFYVTISSSSSLTVTTSGISHTTGNRPGSVDVTTNWTRGLVSSGSGNITMTSGSSGVSWRAFYQSSLNYKPTWATRS
jgi:hypothetical protein